MLEEELNKEMKKLNNEAQDYNPSFFLFRTRKPKLPFKLAENLQDRLSDVKGIDEVREEIEEVVKMLKSPEKYESAGAKLIRGILLIGKPGTGKTLLARALAGESGINFIYVAASEFDKSLVGMGNKLVKKLFQMARDNQPCIIFIDEIDTLLHTGRRSGKFSTSFERGLINTFLAEMDGFQKRDHIFVLGATNSEKDLDKAALRPGRFDKIIHVPIPDKIGRKDIFDLYLKKINLPIKGVSSTVLSQMTPGFTGADIENMVNTAIINAVDVDKKFLDREDFEGARDRIVLGIKRKIKKKDLHARNLLQTAVHEAGHTLVCFKDKFCKEGMHKVTIIPRGEQKGKTSTLIDDMEGTKEEFISMIDMSLGGLLAEEIYFGSEKVGVGCGNDLSRATNLAKSMVKQYAMDSLFGYMVVEDDYIVSHRISTDTRNVLDTSVGNILKQRTAVVKEILNNNLEELKNLSQKLVEYEELNKNDIEKILAGKEPDRGGNGGSNIYSGALAI